MYFFTSDQVSIVPQLHGFKRDKHKAVDNIRNIAIIISVTLTKLAVLFYYLPLGRRSYARNVGDGRMDRHCDV